MARSKLLQISLVFLTYKLRFSKAYMGSESLNLNKKIIGLGNCEGSFNNIHFIMLHKRAK